jgi:hypothetical protein
MHRSKCARISQAKLLGAPTPSLSSASPALPPWFTDGCCLFEELNVESNWQELMMLWIAFEEKEFYSEIWKLSAKN